MPLKAVIAVAGYGTRFFPVSKTINKCMLPIGDKPIVHLAVEDCIAAGVEEIAIVTAPGDTQIRHYFTEDTTLRDHFHERGWDHKYERIADLHDLAEFTFLEQPRDGRYGTALPAMVAADWIDGDDFLLMSGDDALIRTDGGSDLADLVRARWEVVREVTANVEQVGAAAAIAAATVPGDQAHRYGVLIPRDEGLLLDHLEEKPTDYEAELALVNISRAVLPGFFLDYLEDLKPAANGEYQSTDAIQAFADVHDMLIHPVRGAYHDCGDPAGLLAANIAAREPA